MIEPVRSDRTSIFWLPDQPLVLASASRIRSTILSEAGIPHVVAPADIDERILQAQAADLLSDDLAAFLAGQKSIAVSRIHTGRYVLGVDQVCVCGHEILHKAEDSSHLRNKLRKLRGVEHTLVSAAAIARDGKILTECRSSANIKMRDFSDTFLSAYVDCYGEDMLQCVGGYKMEGPGVMLMEQVEGDHFTILGMPLISLLQDLRTLGLILD